MKLTKETFILYASKHYDNPSCSSYEEFQEDLKRFQYLKRLFNRYELTGCLKERLVLNHLIILYNSFGNEATRMLFMQLEDFHSILKPLLIYLNKMTLTVEYEDKVIEISKIESDKKIIKCLEKV